MDYLKTRISSRIKELQKQRNWSASYLAEIADIKYSTLRSWINGRSIPTVDLLTKLCDTFEISLSKFFAEDSVDFAEDSIDIELTPRQQRILDKWELLNDSEKETVLKIMETLTQ